MYSVQYNNTFKVQILYRYVSKDSKQIENVQNIPFQCTAKHEKGISPLFQLSCPPPICRFRNGSGPFFAISPRNLEADDFFAITHTHTHMLCMYCVQNHCRITWQNSLIGNSALVYGGFVTNKLLQ